MPIALPRFRYLLPAVAMMLGWGLRGFIGGGPFGAMIPGAMLLLSLASLYPGRDPSLLAAFAAMGVGFGGEMTYGQTVGFIVKADTFWWGFLGLGLKGAIWGALAAATIALGLVARPRLVAMAGVLIVLATEIGWRFINHPKLIYFSNPHDKPREEIWAGFFLAALSLVFFLRLSGHPQPALRLSTLAFLGGFVGFGVGGAIQGLGRIFTPDLPLHWWKYMEFFFGFCFGLALAHLPLSQHPEPPPAAAPSQGIQLIAYAAATAYLFVAAEYLPVRYAYLLAACPLLLLATLYPWIAKHLAYSLTFTAFAFDLARYWSKEYQRGPAEPAYAIAILASLLFALQVQRLSQDAPRMLEWLTWSAVAVATLKFAIHPTGLVNLIDHVALAFVLMAAAISWMLRNRTLDAQLNSQRKQNNSEACTPAVSSS